jgi:hypothetical protein
MKQNLAEVSPISPARLMPPRGGNKPSSAAKGNQVSSAENHAIMLDTMNGIPRDSRRAWIRALLRSLEAWRTPWDWDAVSLPAIPSTAWSRVSAAVLRTIRQPIYPAKVLQRWIFEFKRDWNSMINSIALPEMQRSFLRRLRQLIHSNIRRQANASPFEARRDLHR